MKGVRVGRQKTGNPAGCVMEGQNLYIPAAANHKVYILLYTFVEMEIVIDIKFTQAPVREWKETGRRVEHIFDRMRLRGIGVNQIREAVQRGAKILRKDGSIIAEFRWFKVIYREFRLKNARKIYPITVYER